MARKYGEMWAARMADASLEERVDELMLLTLSEASFANGTQVEFLRVIGAEHDMLIPIWKLRELAELIPDARLTVIERCPHGVQLERAEDFTRVVLADVDHFEAVWRLSHKWLQGFPRHGRTTSTLRSSP